MKKRLNLLLYATALTTFLTLASSLNAQPGGFGGPGGRPPSGNRNGGRPVPGQNRDWNNMADNEKASTVKQKKKVKEGDVFKVVGSLRDSVTGEFLPFVNVAVLDSADSSFVKGGSTNLDGLFEISEVPQGAHLLRVSAIGYQSLLMPFTVNNNTALGTLRLKPGSTTLGEVTITAAKPLYAMDGEKMVYNVSEDPSIQTGTTNDALQNAPGVEVDVEGNITLRGVSSVEIWVNDKPSKLTEENLKTYLETLPANALARIETITNPSAKYATSAEAVINIITTAHIKSNQFISFGINGGNQPFISPWLSYMWAKEKLSINLFASGRYSNRKNTNGGWSMRRQKNGDDYDTTMAETYHSSSEALSLGGNIFMSVNYEIDSSQEISFDGGFNYTHSNNPSERHTIQTFYGETDSIIDYAIGDTSSGGSMFGHLGADWTKKFDQEGHNLRIGINSRISHNSTDDYYHRLYTTYTDLNENRYLLTQSNTKGLSLDARYNRPYSKDGEMSYGLRADHQSMDNKYSRYYMSAANSYDSIDKLRTYHFTGTETSGNADVNWTHRWGGLTVSSGLGVGVEQIAYKYETDMPFSDDSAFTEITFRPSLHISYRTESMHNFKINYSMRMATPSESQLTHFKIYGEDSYKTGNPNGLSNAITHSTELGWQKYFDRFGNIGIEGYGRLSTNEISSLTDAEYDEFLHRIVSYAIPYNMGTSWRYGTSVNMTYRPSGFFNVRLYANLYDYGYSMDYMRGNTPQHDQRDMVSWSVRLNAWAKIFNQYQVHLSANYNSPTLSLMSERKARYSLNMGVRSDFFKRKLSVFVNIQDIFNWGGRFGSGSENTNPFYLSESTNKMTNSRYVSAGVTLRFGKMELEKQAQNGSDSEGDSL